MQNYTFTDTSAWSHANWERHPDHSAFVAPIVSGTVLGAGSGSSGVSFRQTGYAYADTVSVKGTVGSIRGGNSGDRYYLYIAAVGGDKNWFRYVFELYYGGGTANPAGILRYVNLQAISSTWVNETTIYNYPQQGSAHTDGTTYEIQYTKSTGKLKFLVNDVLLHESVQLQLIDQTLVPGFGVSWSNTGAAGWAAITTTGEDSVETFSPLKIVNATHWWDASDTTTVTKTGTDITGLKNKAGNNTFDFNTVVGVPQHGAVSRLGKPVLSFDGNDALKTGGGAGTNVFTLYVVGKKDSGTGTQWIYSAQASGPAGLSYSSTGFYALNASSNQVTTKATDNDPHVFIAIHDGANSKLYVDGVEYTVPASTGTNGPGGGCIGAHPYNSSYFIGWAAEGGHYSRVLTAPEISQLNSYLSNKWISEAVDTTPDQFTFTDVTNATLNFQYTSNTITVSGIAAAATISITGGEYNINGGAYTSTSGTVNNGDTVTVRVTSGSSNSSTVSATLTIGGVFDTYSVTTVDDTVPEAFSFTDVTGALTSTVYTSNSVTITGISAASPISITGGEYSINGGSFTSASGTILNNQQVQVRVTSSSSNSTAVNAVLTIGGVSDTYTVTTAAADTTPDEFLFTEIVGALTETVYSSDQVAITGLSSAAPVSITDGEYRIDSGAWTSANGSINNGQQIQVRLSTGTEYRTWYEAEVVIGGVSGWFSVKTGQANTRNVNSKVWTGNLNADGTYDTNYQNGDKPTSGSTNFSQILYYEDFTGGTNGSKISTVSSFGTTSAIINDDPLGIHGKVARDDIVAGDKDWASGGVLTIGNMVGGSFPRYSEFWARIKVYMPTGYSYSASPWFKFFRWRTWNAAGTASPGYIDWYLEPDGDHRVIYEGEGTWTQVTTNQAFAPTKGQWQDWEMHVVLDSVTVDAGGQARIDLWRDGVLIGSVTNRRTLNNTTDVAKDFLYQTYWNGGAPQNQTLYWTKAAFAAKIPGGRDDTPFLSTDATGKKFIGTGG